MPQHKSALVIAIPAFCAPLLIAGALSSGCDSRRARGLPDAGVADTPSGTDAPPAPDVPRLGTDAGPPAGPSSLAIVAGDRQIVMMAEDALVPLTVRALDGFGRPVRDAAIEFTVVGGEVTLREISARTGPTGEASVPLRGAVVPPDRSWLDATIEARWEDAVAIFHVTTAFSETGTRFSPAAVLHEPASRDFGVVHSGDVVADLLRIHLTATEGPDAYVGMPGIGLRAVPAEGESMDVRCEHDGVSDLEGMVGCDLVFEGPPGEHFFSIVVGELISFHAMHVFIDPHAEAP